MDLIDKKTLSIADLKAAFDFNRLQIKELKKELKRKDIDFKTNGGYKELSIINEAFYSELMNRVNKIEIDFKK
jgi:hypothetical protein